MAAWTVVDAKEARRWKPKDGPEKAIDHYTLKGSAGRVIAFDYRELNAPLPKPGDVLEGDLTDDTDRHDKTRRRFKKPTRRRGGGGSGFGKRDPKETKAIQRQHSQEMALRFIAIKASIGALAEEPSGKPNFDLSDVFTITDAFERDLDPAAPKPSTVPNDPGA